MTVWGRFVTSIAAAALAVPAVVLAPGAGAMPDPAPRDAQYVSLGDSFVAAGSFANSTTQGCMQAPDDVGRLVAKKLRGVSFGDWACGGAATSDITGGATMGPQVPGLGPSTKYVSVSIGGNDEDLFADLLANCLFSANCTPAVERSAMAKTDRLAANLDTAYAAIREKAPNAEVVVLGYLRLAPDDVTGCFAGVHPGPHGAAVANRVQKKLNAEVKAASERAGFTYLQPTDAASRTMCGPDGQRYVSLTGIGPGDAGIPVHPTLAGRRYSAGLIADAFKR